MIAGTIKSIVPPLMTSAYAFGVSHQIMQGYLAWAILGIIGAALFRVSLLLPPKQVKERNAEV
jgi:hypothetical protein